MESITHNNLSFSVPLFLRRFLGDNYSSDNIRRRVESLVDHAFGGDKISLIEQLSTFCYDVHQFQMLCRSISMGKSNSVFC